MLSQEASLCSSKEAYSSNQQRYVVRPLPPGGGDRGRRAKLDRKQMISGTARGERGRGLNQPDMRRLFSQGSNAQAMDPQSRH